MTLLLILIAAIALAYLAPRYGVDSRDLRDHPWTTRPGPARRRGW